MCVKTNLSARYKLFCLPFLPQVRSDSMSPSAKYRRIELSQTAAFKLICFKSHVLALLLMFSPSASALIVFPVCGRHSDALVASNCSSWSCALFICLLLSALKVKLTCLPYRPCGGGNEAAGGSGNSQDSDVSRKEMCDPSQTQEREKWEQLCTKMDPKRASSAGTRDQEHSWFRCETNKDLTELHTNISPSGTSPVQASDRKLKISV